MDNKNLVIGILAIIILGGAIWAIAATTGSSGMATSTPTGVTDNTPNNTPATASAPQVTTGTLVVASNSSAVLTGKVIPNGLQTTYWYEYGQTSALGSKSIVQSIGSGYSSISAPVFIPGLAANTSYSYRLVAQNSLNTVSGSILSFTTNNNPPPAGSAPLTHTDAATRLARTSVTLNGHVSPNSSDTSFWFEYGTTNNLGNTTSFQSAGNGSGSFAGSVSVSGLNPSTTYYYRMNAQNQFGTVTGATLSFVTTGPASPSAPSADTTSASNINRTSATLNAQVNPNGAATTYWFEYSTDSLLGSILGTTTHQAIAGSGTSNVNVSAAITGLTRNTNYSYRVVTSNSAGTTDGDIVSFKTSN